MTAYLVGMMPAPSGPAMAMPAGTATMAVPGPKVGALRLVSTRHERPMVNKPCKTQTNRGICALGWLFGFIKMWKKNGSTKHFAGDKCCGSPPFISVSDSP